MRALTLIIAIVASGVAQSETLEQKLNYEAARQALYDIKTEMSLGICFDHARLMMFGAYQKEQGRPIEVFVDSGALPLDSSEYKFVLDGYSMSGFMDNASKEYFLECVKPVLYETK